MRRYYLYYIIGGIVVIAAVAAAILFWFNRSSSVFPGGGSESVGSLPTVTVANPGAQTPPGSSPSGISGFQFGASDSQTPSAAPGTLGVVSSEQVLDYFLNASGTMIDVQPNGKIEQISGGQSVYLSSQEINDVISAKFSYDGRRVLVLFGNPSAPQSSVFDVAAKSWTPLPENLIVAAWSPVNYELAYFSRNAQGAALQKIDLGNAKAKPTTLLSLTNEDYELSWPAPAAIIISDRPSALFSGSIFAFNPKTGTLSAVVQNRVGLEGTWNASGTEAVVSAGTALARGGQLGVIDSAGNLLHQMTFLTLPTKCAFYTHAATTSAATASASGTAPAAKSAAPAAPSQLLLCGVPRDASMLSGNPLPDAYEERRVMTSDDVYAINLNDGSFTTIFNDTSRSFDMSNVKVLNGALFFVNRYDQKLYGFTLGQ